MNAEEFLKTKDGSYDYINLKVAAEWLEEYSSIKVSQANEWVDVNERLPELDESVLLFDDWKSTEGKEYKDIRIGHLSQFTTSKSSTGIQNYCEWGGTESAFNITHWMPLPPNPKK